MSVTDQLRDTCTLCGGLGDIENAYSVMDCYVCGGTGKKG